MFKFAFLLVCFFSFSFGANVFDKFTLFVEGNHQSNKAVDISNYNYLIGGASIDKNIQINGNSRAYLSWYVKSAENTDGNYSVDLLFKEAYVEFQIEHMKARAGRSIIDLSTSKIYSINTFLSPITFILDPTDRSLSLKGLTGLTLDGDIGVINSKWLLHIYQNIDNEDFRTVLQVRNTQKFIDSNLYAGIDKYKDFFISGSTSLVLNDNANFYIEGKYKENKPNYVVGFDYSVSNGVALAVERILKNKESILSSGEKSNMLSYLRDSDYIGGYLRLPYNHASVNSILGFYNLIDKSRVIAFQNEYSLNDIKIFSELINNSGSDKSEFGSNVQYIFKINLSVNLD